MIAVVPIREGRPSRGGEEAIAEARGHAILIGSGVAQAAAELRLGPLFLTLLEADSFEAGAWTEVLNPFLARLADPIIILPASPDGRDLAPRLAHRMGRRLFAGAIVVTDTSVITPDGHGHTMLDFRLDVPCVVTLQPGVRGVEIGDPTSVPSTVERHLDREIVSRFERLATLEADPDTVSLADARRILSGGQGVGSRASFERLSAVASMVGASVGGTRVAVDRGWLPIARQIGVTGLSIAPDLYIAIGISGAPQHLAAVTRPRHVIAVNTDATCPMMETADLAIVADAPAVLEALYDRLAQRTSTP